MTDPRKTPNQPYSRENCAHIEQKHQKANCAHLSKPKHNAKDLCIVEK